MAGRKHARTSPWPADARPAAVTHQQGSILARLGGDEFTVLLEDIAGASDAIRVAERLRSALEKPFDVEGRQVFVSATVGIIPH
jgi:GGDEF domain-containing protein